MSALLRYEFLTVIEVAVILLIFAAAKESGNPKVLRTAHVVSFLGVTVINP